MKILSIDVGIKNLAFCLFQQNNDHLSIVSWDIINLSQPKTLVCTALEKNKPCGKPAKYEYDYENNNACFCLKHAKKQTNYLLPTAALKPASIKKQKISALQETVTKFKIPFDAGIKKADLVNLVLSFLSQHSLQEVEKVNASKVDLIEIGTNIKMKFKEWFQNEGKIDYVLIENQISPIANRMKTIQGMICQYFIMSEENEVGSIQFVSSSNKLKESNNASTSSTTYKERKSQGIAKCLEILGTNETFQPKLTYFQSHKKKDDLADSFLQGMWFINSKLN